MLGVRSKVMEGHALADGLADFPSAFPEIYRATVAAGEQSGHLDTVLERLADYTETREQLRSRTLNAMLYPILLFIVCAGIVALLLTFVVPKIVKQFENAKHDLPMLTKVLIGFSDFLRHYGFALLLAISSIGCASEAASLDLVAMNRSACAAAAEPTDSTARGIALSTTRPTPGPGIAQLNASPP